MNEHKFHLALTAIFLIGTSFISTLSAQSSRSDCYGQDKAYDFSVKTLQTPAPNGYKPFYISHYGRHGSRYAYNAVFYDEPHEMFSKALQNGNLTGKGREVALRFEQWYPLLKENMGLLTDKGREQHRELARRMYADFPQAFPNGAKLLAVSSPSMRCVISMASFCTGLAGCDSSLDITMEQSPSQTACTAPRDKSNSRYVSRQPAPELPAAMMEPSLEYFARAIDCNAILARLFKDPAKAIESITLDPQRSGPVKGQKATAASVVWHLRIFAAGMASIVDGPDFDDIFTEKEWIESFRADCYMHFKEYYNYLDDCCQVIEDILNDCKAAAQDGRCGAKLRFGHDHVIFPLLSLLGIDRFGETPQRPEDCWMSYPLYMVPMASNLQFVLYRGPEGKILVKTLLNSKEIVLPGCDSVYCSLEQLESLISEALERHPVIA